MKLTVSVSTIFQIFGNSQEPETTVWTAFAVIDEK